MVDSIDTSGCGARVRLLDVSSVGELLGWVPGHQRKFAEASATARVAGWESVFSKFEAYDRIARLLGTQDGLAVADDICSKAGVRGVTESILKRARSALPVAEAHNRSTRAWPGLLSQAGKEREAAWVLWLQERSGRAHPEADELAGSHAGIAELLGRPANQPFTEPDGDVCERIVGDLRRELSERDPDDRLLPALMRDAADALESAGRAAEERIQREAARREEALRDLLDAQGRVERSGGNHVQAANAILDAIAAAPDGMSTEALDAILAAASAYAGAAARWRNAFETLSATHDYTGVQRAHEDEGEAWLALHAVSIATPAASKALAGKGVPTGSDPSPAHGQVAEPSDAPRLETAGAESLGIAKRTLPATVGDAIRISDASGVVLTHGSGDASDLKNAPECAGDADTSISALSSDARTGEDALVAPRAGSGGEVNATLARLATEASAVSLANRRFGLAAKVAVAASNGGVAVPFGFSATLLDALVAGLAIGEPGCERAVERYESVRDRLVEELEAGAGRAFQLLAFAAALRPALFAIAAGAEAVLRQTTSLRTLGDGLAALAHHAAEVARKGEIAPAELAEVRDRLAPERELAAYRADTRRYLEQAQRKTIKYQRATVIWTNLLRTGPVASALRALADGDADTSAKVSAVLAGELANVNRLVMGGDRDAMNGRKAQPLTAGARETLEDWVNDVANRLRRWQALNEAASAPEPNRYFSQNRQELRRLLGDALRELAVLGSDRNGEPYLAEARALLLAARVAEDAVASVLQLFDPVPPSPLSLEMRFEDDVLLLPSPWEPSEAALWTASQREAFFAEVGRLADDAPDFRGAFERALAGGRLPRAARARDRLLIEDAALAEGMDLRLKGERDRRIGAARGRLGELRKRLHDLLGADDRQILNRDLGPELDKLEDVLQEGDPQIDFSDWDLRVAGVDAELDRASASLLGPLQRRLVALEAGGHDVADLRKMEELKDLTTLAEHIEAYEKGAAPPEPPANLLEAFSAHVHSAQDRRPDLPALQRAAARRERAGTVDFGTFEDGQLEASVGLLDAWRELKSNANRDSASQVQRLFQALLTSQVEVQQDKEPGSLGRYILKTPTYADREECVAPAFGSVAQGRYDVILVESQNVGSGHEPAALKGRGRASTFFVIRGQMPAAARRAFMVQVRGKGSSPACGLIDEALVLFLASRPTRRRSDLFGLALAMGVVQPYSDTAQQTSPEMFFGRAEELREIWDPNGSCLVYGGRQLGKTALLRQIELRHGGGAQIVVYGDQMAEGFGDGRPATFWNWIGKAVQGRGVPVPPRPSSEAVREAIRSWLREDGTRRLLFLIDEADIFLRTNIRNDYRVLVEVRELMRVTDRRCKFVFAGLHDVQRLARTPNSPLLHFGNPIRVGPLMGKDLFEARSMVEQPMAAAGYAFGATSAEGRALVGRALSEVGYYPSLMQTFGMVLVNRLNGRASARIGTPPTLPIRIGAAELNEALDDNSFRDSVRTKFDNTLNLDPRYRLIAYLVLLGTQESASREDMRPGMSIAEIQRDALYWWPQGFAEDPSNGAFEGLLKEMEGLGALVGLSDGRYAIRSARIAAMLGTLQEVGDRVQEIAGQLYTVAEDTGSSRRLVSGAPSPFTFRQEGVLFETRGTPAVTVALTSQALGLGSVVKAVEDLARDDDTLTVVTAGVTSVGEMERAIATAAERAKQRQRGRALLVAEGPWLGREAVEAAFAHPEVRRAHRASMQGVRVLLLPRMVDWLELTERPERLDRLWQAGVLTLGTLQEGGLAEWLRRRTSEPTVPGQAERLRAATGGFPAYLGALRGKTNEELVAAAEAAAAGLTRASGSALSDLGLGDQRLRAIAMFVRDQADGRVDAEDRDALVALMGEAGLRSADHGLDALEQLGVLDHVLEVDAPAGLRLNPLVVRLLD